MKKYTTYLNIGIIIFFIICLICPVLWLFEIEIYFDIMGGMISFDMFFFSFILLFSLLYIKLARIHYAKIGKKSIIIVWGLPLVIGIPVLILGIVSRNAFLALACAFIMNIVILIILRSSLLEILLSGFLSVLMIMFTVLIFFVGIMLMPMNNRHFESYEEDGVYYITSQPVYGVDPDTAPKTIYRMTSPITMVKVDD